MPNMVLGLIWFCLKFFKNVRYFLISCYIIKGRVEIKKRQEARRLSRSFKDSKFALHCSLFGVAADKMMRPWFPRPTHLVRQRNCIHKSTGACNGPRCPQRRAPMIPFFFGFSLVKYDVLIYSAQVRYQTDLR